MKKEIRTKFNKKYYLLGKDHENHKVWLEEGHFDCDWYWGIGYVETFNHNYTDIVSHTHFDSLFFNQSLGYLDAFKAYFIDTPLSKDEIWKLLELMQTLYTMRKYSDILHTGGAHITTNTLKDLIKNDDEYKRINKVVIPQVLKEVYKLLGGED